MRPENRTSKLGNAARARRTDSVSPVLDASPPVARWLPRGRHRGHRHAQWGRFPTCCKRLIPLCGLTLALCFRLGASGFGLLGFAASEGHAQNARFVPQTGTIKAPGVPLRPEPSAGSAPTGTLSRGQVIDILGWEGGWYYVRVGRLGVYDVVGYVREEQVTLPDSASVHPGRETTAAVATRPTGTPAPHIDTAYYVQAGVLADPDNAARLVNELKAAGYAAVQQETVILERGSYTKVTLGPFRIRQEAARVVGELKVLGTDAIVRAEQTERVELQRPDGTGSWEDTAAVQPSDEQTETREPRQFAVASVAPAQETDDGTVPPEAQAKANLSLVEPSPEILAPDAAAQAPTPLPSVPGIGIRPVKSLLEMRRDKTVVQQWDLSCGAAALATLLTYQHNDPVPEREIARGLIRREEYIANPGLIQARQGFSLLDLKRYVEQRGYVGVGYGRLTFEDLIERAPIMVPVDFYGYKHFVIFRGMMGNRVLLADPAWGKRTMLRESFEKAWLVYPEVGSVGFVVQRSSGPTPPNRLAPQPNDFVSFR